MASQGSIRIIKIRFLWIHGSFKFAGSLPKRSQIGIRCSGTKKYSQRFEIGHFCPGTFSALQSSKIDTNPIGKLSVLPFQYPIYLWLQASAWKVNRIGGWCVPEYRFRNLWFKHRGIQLALWWYTIQLNPHPQPPYQASAWSYGYRVFWVLGLDFWSFSYSFGRFQGLNFLI